MTHINNITIMTNNINTIYNNLNKKYNTPRFSDRHNYGGMTRNRYICKKEENQNGKTI